MATLQAVLDRGRVPLNDAKDTGGSDAACRYPDSQLLAECIHGLLLVWRNRSDLFVGNFNSPPTLAMTAITTFPLPDEYIQPLADYVTARVESGDDEFVDGGRAAQFFSLFSRTVKP